MDLAVIVDIGAKIENELSQPLLGRFGRYFLVGYGNQGT